MTRIGDFTRKIKREAIQRQDRLCAICGISLITPWPKAITLDTPIIFDRCVMAARQHLKTASIYAGAIIS